MKNSNFGLTLQKVICDLHNITPKSQHCIEQFAAAYNSEIAVELKKVAISIFDDINVKPIECTTFVKHERNLCPYNFVLSNGKTVSIRTNFSSSKVAPRIVGQAGYKILNEYFSKIYGKNISSQEDIKELFINKIDDVLPIFVDKLFDADYIIWLHLEKSHYKYIIIDGSSSIPFDYSPKNFTFTKSLKDWNESNTLKYKNISIAEIQVHKNRTFKFRFQMDKILPIIASNSFNNETLGMTAEKTICDLYSLDYPANLNKRFSKEIESNIKGIIQNAFEALPKPIKYSGQDKPEGKKSQKKSPYDFILEGDKKLSVKTNIGKMVCPPDVGQPSSKTCFKYFKHLIPNEDHIDSIVFKKMVLKNVTEMMKIYLFHLFDSDYLLRIYLKDGKYSYQCFPKGYGSDYKWDKEKFSFSKTLETWNESNTLYYNNKSIGEFQVHKHRNCYKFRFIFDELIKILKK